MRRVNKILWLSWKDRKHPLAGGAETVNEMLAKRLTMAGYEVIFIVAGFPGCLKEERINGYRIIRLGRRLTVYFEAWRYYQKHLQGWPDLVIDEINTIPFFAKFYVKERNILFVYQLCREVWFYEQGFPLNLIGYLMEPVYLWLLRDRAVVTISESTKKDLLKYGFGPKKINIISVGIEFEPLKTLLPIEEVKAEMPTILFLGTLRKMKRPAEVIAAFEIAKKEISDLKLWIAGAGNEKITALVKNSPYQNDISYFGRVEEEKKRELLLKAHLICVPSVKEGWGLVVTEANSQGTPAIVYNVDGLRDSVRDKETGIICKRNNPEDLAENIIGLIKNKPYYNQLRQKAWQWSREINFEKSASQFIDFLKQSNRK